MASSSNETPFSVCNLLRSDPNVNKSKPGLKSLKDGTESTTNALTLAERLAGQYRHKEVDLHFNIYCSGLKSVC